MEKTEKKERSLHKEKLMCSVCGKKISSGEDYSRDLISDKIVCAHCNGYADFRNSDEITQKFCDLLAQFLTAYFQEAEIKPLEYYVTLFRFPGEKYEEPMVQVIYPDLQDFNHLELRDELEVNFKRFLAAHSGDLGEFKAFRALQRKFRFVIQRA